MSELRVPDLNTVVIAGRLTRDPELRYTQSGMAFCRLTIANTRYYKNRSGERCEETTFIDASLWDKQAEWVGECLKKGRPVIIEGKLKTDQWEDKNTGQKRSRVEIKANRITPLDWDEEAKQQAQKQQEPPRQQTIEEPIPEDNIPF